MSRINKRKNDEIFSDEENEPTAMTTFSNISSPSEITARKKKRATVKGITSRKSDRTKRFYLEMLELDHKFSEWSRNKEEALCRLIETGKLSPTDDPASMCTAQVELYMQCVANIKRRYKPPTGDVLTFGSGFSFQLGHPLKDGADTDSAEPRVIMGLRNMGFTSISCGGCHTLAIQENGQVWSWGGGEFGSLGLVGMEETEVPKQVKGFVPSRYEVAKGLKEVKTLSDVIGAAVEDPNVHLPLFDEKIVAIGTGDLHSLCLSETGRVYFFGSYGDGDQKKFRDAIPPDDKRFIVKYEKETLNLDEVQSDELDTTNVEVDVKELKALPPTKPPKGQQDWPLHVYQLDGEATDIDCGYGFNAAIVDKNGSKSCYTWGIGDCGELGRPVPAIKIYRDELEEVTDDKGDKVFDGNGNVKTKIVNVPDYQYDSIRQDYLVPKQVVWEDPMVNREVVAIACGGYHLLIVSKNLETGAHAIHSSGLNNYGQLGLGHEKNMDKLTEVSNIQILVVMDGTSEKHFNSQFCAFTFYLRRSRNLAERQSRIYQQVSIILLLLIQKITCTPSVGVIMVNLGIVRSDQKQDIFNQFLIQFN